MKTIVTEIEQLETEISKSESRLDDIERLGRLADMTDEEWSRLKVEKTQLEHQLVTNRKKLKKLRWENWKTMIVSVIILGAGYLTFTLLYNTPSAEVAQDR
ncbi:uncharacterized protein LOC101849587 isoform X2 [Aplysia californica]|uniref:Coiled-coil domain-containing protein 167 n=1 Tax=Aplysia californica TaxID=6500 RepID=A0ABM0KA65_APLCA|nr:uncharacterized protein LOC101849587 isoform X2 [Aplysia californica]